MRKQLIFILIFLSIHNISFAQKNEILETYTLNISDNKNYIINIYEYSRAQKQIRIFENTNNIQKEIGNMLTICLSDFDSAEGYQYIIIKNNGFIVQQSFSDGHFYIFSRLYFELYNNSFVLSKYTEIHVDRYSDDKDFTEKEIPLSNTYYFSDINDELIFDLHSHLSECNTGCKAFVNHATYEKKLELKIE